MALVGITCDWQLDWYSSRSILRPSGLTSRFEDVLGTVAWVFDTCIKRGCESVIVLGDIFESRTVLDLTVLDRACRLIHEKSRHVRIIFVAGNHDSALRRPDVNSIQVFRGVAEIVESPTTLRTDDKTVLGLVPWYDDHASLTAGIDTVSKQGAEYLFTHVLVEGAVPKGKGLPLSALRPKKFRRVLLGDVHEPVQLDDNVQYVGSPLQIDFRDAGGRRGFAILNTELNEVEFIENTHGPRFHVLRGKPEKGQVKKGDFVRVDVQGVQESEAIAGMLRHLTEWVETTAVEVEDTPVRLDVRTSTPREEALKAYIAHCGIADGPTVERLLAKGLGFMLEAKGH